MWAWLPVYLQVAWTGRQLTAVPLSIGSAAAFAVFGVGAASCVLAGAVAERWGRTSVTATAMLASGSTALVIGFVPPEPGLVTVLALAWGATVVADSAQFSAAMTELANERYRGSALALRRRLGSFSPLPPSVRCRPSRMPPGGDQPSPCSRSDQRWVPSRCLSCAAFLRRLEWPEAADEGAEGGL